MESGYDWIHPADDRVLRYLRGNQPASDGVIYAISEQGNAYLSDRSVADATD